MIGRGFGNYKALSLLGEGGMGAVYLAEHPAIGRKVAIKVLRDELSRDEQTLGRFLNEARAANAIRHPNIIEILDSGTTPEGTAYLVMELLEGQSLGGRLRSGGKLGLREALDLAAQAASALSAAHAQGIVHRDLKPDNLFLIPNPDSPARIRLKVLDFGIAKLAKHQHGDSVRTRTGTLMGTPVYMSPEQCLGTKEVDHRSDLYSLGCIMFEMLAGHPPFFSEGFGELVNMHLNQAPPSLSAINLEVPATIDAVIARCLAKRPDQRFQTAKEIVSALKSALGPGFFAPAEASDSYSDTLNGQPAYVPVVPPPRSTTPLQQAETDAAGRSGTVMSVHTGGALPAPGTFSGGTGEASMRTGAPKNKLPVVLGGVAIAALGAAVLLFGGGNKGTTFVPPATIIPAPAAIAAPAPKTFRIQLASDPSGAEIKDSRGLLWGKTPLAREVEGGTETLVLTKEGFAQATLSLILDRDRNETVRLEPTADPVAPTKPAVRRHTRRKPEGDEPAKL